MGSIRVSTARDGAAQALRREEQKMGRNENQDKKLNSQQEEETTLALLDSAKDFVQMFLTPD